MSDKRSHRRPHRETSPIRSLRFTGGRAGKDSKVDTRPVDHNAALLIALSMTRPELVWTQVRKGFFEAPFPLHSLPRSDEQKQMAALGAKGRSLLQRQEMTWCAGRIAVIQVIWNGVDKNFAKSRLKKPDLLSAQLWLDAVILPDGQRANITRLFIDLSFLSIRPLVKLSIPQIRDEVRNLFRGLGVALTGGNA